MSNFSNIPPFGEDPAIRNAAARAAAEAIQKNSPRKKTKETERMALMVTEYLLFRQTGYPIGLFEKRDGTTIPATPLNAWNHYLSDTEEPLRFSMRDLYPELKKQNVTVSSFADFHLIVQQGIGKYDVELRRNLDTTGDFGLIFGNLTLKFKGTIQLDKGHFVANGVYKCFDDKYDFNPSTHRPWYTEPGIRAIFHNIPRKVFYIEIRGEVQINEYTIITECCRKMFLAFPNRQTNKHTIINKTRQF